MPQYSNIFIGCIDLSIGYFFGAFSPNTDKVEPMDARAKHLILRIVLVAVPFICLLLIIIVIHLIGLLTESLLESILIGGSIIMGVMYIAASIYIGEKYSALYKALDSKTKAGELDT